MADVRSVLKRLRGDRVVAQHSREQRALLLEQQRLLREQAKRLEALEGLSAVDGLAERLEARLDQRLEELFDQHTKEVIRRIDPGAGMRASFGRDGWASKAQEGELAFHKARNFRANEEQWQAAIIRDWKLLGIEPTGWEGKVVVDVGAGSRLRSLYFRGAHLVVVEPLAARYQKEVEWCDLDQADEVYSIPAEELIPELEGKADLIVSINALDHGYDFEGGIRNIARYLKPDGLAVLGFDQHDVTDDMHPLILNEEICRAVFEDAGLRVERTQDERRYHGTEGKPAMHFWLRRAA